MRKIPSHAALVRPAKQGIHIACIIQPVRMVHLDHPAADGKDALRLTDRTHHLRHEILVHPDVII